jgi:hypothetical protein
MNLKKLSWVVGSTIIFNVALLPSAWAEPSRELTPLSKTSAIDTKPSAAGDISRSTKPTEVLPIVNVKGQNQISQTASSTSSVLQKFDALQLQESQHQNSLEDLSQVSSVSQLSDVRSSDWAFTALQSLVERYGCIAGFPDGMFRGGNSMSRYEFAAGLNACADKINEIISSGLADKVSKDDLASLSKLQEEFAAELTTLRGRVDALDLKVNKLESQQFTTVSATNDRAITVMGGEAIFALSTAGGGKPPGKGENNTTLTYSSRIGIVSTFTGKDRLRLELASGNFSGGGYSNSNSLNTNTALLSFQSDTANQIQLSRLEYRFPILNDRAVLTFQPVGFSLSSVLSANSPYFDSGRGAISRFAELSPVFRIGNLDAGVGFDWLISDRVRLQYAYGASNANNPSTGGGLFGSNDQAMGLQLLLVPANNVLTGLTFVYGNSNTGALNTFTGSAIADASGFINQPAQIYGINGSLQWRISPKLTFATWGGLIGAYASKTDAFSVSSAYLFSLGLSDLFSEGDLFAFLFGQPLKIISLGNSGASSGLTDTASSLHFETFYRFNLTRNITVTPGFFLVTSPGNVAGNNTIYVGTLRTTFRF